MNNALINAFEDCLTQIASGKNLDEVLSLYPQLGEDLRPLLTTALAVQTLRGESSVPAYAQASSRAALLAQARGMNKAAPARFWGFRSALAGAIAFVVVIILGTGIASAQAIPGDMLYPVKLAREQTQLIFVTNPAQKLALEQSFDQERAGEAEALIAHGRESEVTFSGILTNSTDGRWRVAKMEIIFPDQLLPQVEILLASYVEVHGTLQATGSLLVEQIRLRQVEFTGTLQKMNGDRWIISNIPITITGDTDIYGQADTGQDVRVTALRREDGSLVASTIDSAEGKRDVTPSPSSSPLPTEIDDIPDNRPDLEPTSTRVTDQEPTEVHATRTPGSSQARDAEHTRTPTAERASTATPNEKHASDDEHHSASPTPEHVSGEHSKPSQTPEPQRDH